MNSVVVLTPTEVATLVREGVRAELGAILREMGRPSDVLTSKEAAVYLNQSENTLRQWRMQSRGPAFLKDSHGVRYLKKDLDAWLNSNKVLTAEAPHARSY